MARVPTVFISYSHDSAPHNQWVLSLARRLVRLGVDVVFDGWDLRLGQSVTAFMNASIAKSDRVLVICTEKYVDKANLVRGGAGYEGQILNAELADQMDSIKCIPIVRSGNGKTLVPTFLTGRLYVDMRDDSAFEAAVTDLVHDIHGVPRDQKPAIGESPFASTAIPKDSLTEDIPEGRVDCWQDDDNLFRDARKTLSQRDVTAYSRKAHIQDKLGLHAFTGDDDKLQVSRLAYLDHVLTVLANHVGKREAVEIWLRGIDEQNGSLEFHETDPSCVEDHRNEIEDLTEYLQTAAEDITDPEIRDQVIKWLGIHAHNMKLMRY